MNMNMKRVMVSYKQLADLDLDKCVCVADLGSALEGVRCLFRAYVEVPSDALTAGSLVRVAAATWEDLESRSCAYYRRAPRAVGISSVWVTDASAIRGIVPIALMADGFALAPGSRPDSSRFAALSADEAFMVLRRLPMADRAAALASSPALQSMCTSSTSSHVDVDVSELTVEVVFSTEETTAA